MAIFITGATSQIGYFLLNRLRRVNSPVLALTRGQLPAEGGCVQWRQGTIESLPAEQGLQAIVSFGPLTELAQWLRRHAHAPAPRLVATSSMSVLSKPGSRVDAERAIARQLAEGEAAVGAECERLGMRWTVLRPTLIYGAGRDRSLTPVARRAMRLGVFPWPRGNGLRQPVHADDLAQVVLRLLADDVVHQSVLEVGGGERLSIEQMFLRVRQALPRRTLPVPVPAPMMRLAGSLVPSVCGPVSRLEMDLLADNAPLHELLGFNPRPFSLQPWMLGVGEDWERRLSEQMLEEGC